MSTSYVTNKKNIKLSDLLEISEKVKGIVVEHPLKNFDEEERQRLIDQLKKRKSELSRDEYRSSLGEICDSQISYKKTKLEDFKKSQTFRISGVSKNGETTNYLYVYTDQNRENCTFCRYGSNDVYSIILLTIFQY